MNNIKTYLNGKREIVVDNNLEDNIYKVKGNIVLMNYNTLKEIEEKQSKESEELWK